MPAARDYVPLTVTAVKRETADAVAISLAVPDHLHHVFAFRPGQFLDVRARISGQEVRRSYSICSGPGEPQLRIAVKRVEGGLFSTWANDALVVGDSLDVMPPQGRFTLADTDGSARHLLGLAAGAGITPILSMIAHALANEPATRVTLVYGNRTPDGIMFREELEDLKDRSIDRFTLAHVLSRSDSEDGALFEGRITPQVLKQMAGVLVPFEQIAHAYLCGPGTMIKELRTALFSLGVARDRVHHEFFAAGGGAYRNHPSPAPGDAVTPPATAPAPTIWPTATFEAILDGMRHRIAIAPGETVIDAALRAGLRVPFSCRGGMCCTCRAKIIEGHAEMRLNYSLEAWEIEQGFTLTCQAVPQSERFVVDFDRV
jgi:ring-1,2-phenylacetyl-CoA epoxidase subunit PaaE